MSLLTPLVCFLVFICALPAAATAAPDGTPQTAVTTADLDAGTFEEWYDGLAQTENLPREGPRMALWTRETHPDFRGVTFGESAAPGVRHLRIGLNRMVAVGS